MAPYTPREPDDVAVRMQGLAGSKLAGDALSGVPIASQLLSADRWLLWLGVLFVLSVYHFPTGIVGRLRGKV